MKRYKGGALGKEVGHGVLDEEEDIRDRMY